MKKIIVILLLSNFALLSNAQVAADREDLKKKDTLVDVPYPYMLPILGKKAARAGFNLPYSAGIGVNYLYQKSDIIISDLSAGFNHNPMYSLDNIIKFNSATVTSQGFNVRPDLWVLPFLNVYGIFAKSYSTTAIDANLGVQVPDADWRTIAHIQTKAEFEGTTTGFGFTPTMAVRGIWMAFDMNFTWTDIPALEKPAYIYIFGPRFGKNIKLKKPDQSIAFWVGGFRVKMSSNTTGSLPIGDLFDTDGAHQKIDEANANLDQAKQDVDTWWAGVDQQDPRNIAKKEAADNAIDKAEGIVDQASGAVNNIDNSSVQYSLTKKPADMWNFIVGTQYQFNKHWMLRAEFGFLSARTQVLAGLQYRFGL